MGLETVRRLAGSILKAGESRVKFVDAVRAKEALTRDDVRSLIQEGVIVVEQKKGIGRAKARFKQSRTHAGRRRGPGSTKGAKYAVVSRKTRWVLKVRSQRNLLKLLKPSLNDGEFRRLYKMVKGNFFRSKRHLITFAKENNLISGGKK
ncbi:TPA: 50S ribosomal protein L19e [Candidatus Micrarchaeota archaeon]|nr:50S ribosomal protein L19e [Candidatus Micrarchaeota archaeon]